MYSENMLYFESKVCMCYVARDTICMQSCYVSVHILAKEFMVW